MPQSASYFGEIPSGLAGTRATLRIQSEHVLRGYEAVARRLAQTLSAEVAVAVTEQHAIAD
jgi:hypothetical protein